MLGCASPLNSIYAHRVSTITQKLTHERPRLSRLALFQRVVLDVSYRAPNVVFAVEINLPPAFAPGRRCRLAGLGILIEWMHRVPIELGRRVALELLHHDFSFVGMTAHHEMNVIRQDRASPDDNAAALYVAPKT